MELLEATEQEQVPIDVARLTVGGQLRVRKEARRFLDLRSQPDKSETVDGMAPFRPALFVRGCVGILPLNDEYAVNVLPKAPAAITAMLKAVGRTDAIVHAMSVRRRYRTISHPSEAMLDHLVDAFLGAAQEVASEGLFRTYERTTDVSSHPRGRLLPSGTMRLAARGAPYLVQSEQFERTVTNPPNQSMLAALRWALAWNERYVATSLDGSERTERSAARARRDHEEARARTIRALIHHWRHVEPDASGYFLRDPQVQSRVGMPGNRRAYQAALPLALALLLRRGFSLDAASGDLAFQSLLVDTDTLFETFVRTRLSADLTGSGLRVRNGNALSPIIHLYESAVEGSVSARLAALGVARTLKLPNAPIEPDLLIEDDRGHAVLVMDAKYKIATQAASTADVRQLITYAVNRKATKVVSIHPRQATDSMDPTARLYVTGRIGGITVYQYRLALDADDLELETAMMAEVVRILATDS